MNQGPSEGRGSRVTGRGYQQLRAWQKAHALALCSFRAAETLRPAHRWLSNQLARSAVSVAANIAEGYNRGSLRSLQKKGEASRGHLLRDEPAIYSIDPEDVDFEPASVTHDLSPLTQP